MGRKNELRVFIYRPRLTGLEKSHVKTLLVAESGTYGKVAFFGRWC